MDEALQWYACINCEEFPKKTFLDACEYVMNYVHEQPGKVMDYFDLVWVSCGDEIITVKLISKIVEENRFSM